MVGKAVVVTSCGCLRYQGWWHGDGYMVVVDLVEHRQVCNPPSLSQGLELKFLKHQSNTGSAMVSMEDEPSCSPLCRLQHLDEEEE